MLRAQALVPLHVEQVGAGVVAGQEATVSGWRERLALQLRLGWSHEFGDVARPVTATFAGAAAMPFTTYGASPQRDGVVLGFAANTAIAQGTTAFLRYEGDISGQDSAHALTAGVRIVW